MKPLDDITLKLDRAKEHLQVLKDEITAYVDAGPHTFDSKIERQGGCDVIVATILRINREPPPQLSLVLGDVLHNLRATLDYLAYQLSAAKTTDPAILGDSEFPIFESQTFYARRDKRGCPVRGSGLWKIRAIDPGAQAIIEGLQPYHGGKGYKFDPLWKLHNLCNIDKHRRLHVIHPPIGSGTLRCQGAVITKTETFFARPFVDGAVIARCWVTLPAPGAHMEMRHYLPQDVIVNEADVWAHNVLETMDQVVSRIEGDVIRSLAPFLPP